MLPGRAVFEGSVLSRFEAIRATVMIPQFLDDLQRGTVNFLGILCVLAFLLNAVLLVWLLVKKSTHGLARCPKCGRTIACPHCNEDKENSGPETQSAG